jgi:hypothetical protein
LRPHTEKQYCNAWRQLHDDDDDVAKNQTGNSVVGRVEYVKRERRLARQFIDIYPSQFQRRLNNDF